MNKRLRKKKTVDWRFAAAALTSLAPRSYIRHMTKHARPRPKRNRFVEKVFVAMSELPPDKLHVVYEGLQAISGYLGDLSDAITDAGIELSRGEPKNAAKSIDDALRMNQDDKKAADALMKVLAKLLPRRADGGIDVMSPTGQDLLMRASAAEAVEWLRKNPAPKGKGKGKK